MSDDVKKLKSAPAQFKSDNTGSVQYNAPVLGIVKNNIDPARMGRLQVHLADSGTADENDSNNWIKVDYMSPFFGSTPNAASPESNGDYVSNPQSYGMWATPPDIGTTVVCIFVNGDINFGYYIGCVPSIGQNHMVPAVGASSSVIVTSGESGLYGGAGTLPVAELNFDNKEISASGDFNGKARPVHSYAAATFHKQGLVRDTVRGPISSSAARESPSRVFGISTPGRPVYNGGYTDENIQQKASGANDENLRVVARRAGHTFVLDDGAIDGKDQLIRLRTSSGHQIMMNDSEDIMCIIHASGKSWVEFGKEGTIDMYSMNSINARSQGDINMHADRDINMHAGRKLNMFAQDINTQSSKTYSIRAENFAAYSVKNTTIKVGGSMAFSSNGDAGFASSGKTFINGSKVCLNTGSIGLTPPDVKSFKPFSVSDTVYTPSGYVPKPGGLETITSRAPAHHPWEELSKGVDVKVNLVKAASSTAAPTSSATVDQPSPGVVATVPTVVSASPSSVSSSDLSATVATVSSNPPINPVSTKSVTIGVIGASPSTLEKSGAIKPGTADLINKNTSNLASQKMPSSVFSGTAGTSLSQYANPSVHGSSVASELNNTLSKTGGSITDAIKSIGGSERTTELGNTAKIGSLANSAKLPQSITPPKLDANQPIKLSASGLLESATAKFDKLVSSFGLGPKSPPSASNTVVSESQTGDIRGAIDSKVQPPKV